MTYLLSILVTFIISLVLTKLVMSLAWRFDVLDKPTSPRKIHQKPIPLLGGLAIFVSFFLVLSFYLSSSDVIYNALHQSEGTILPKNLWGIFLAGVIIMISGVLDDKYNLSPRKQLIGPVLAVIVVIASGIGIKFITNPLGGLIFINTWQTKLFTWHGTVYKISWMADIFTFVWLMCMMYTTKILDGLDGLVSGITGLGALFIFFLSLKIHQPFTALLAALLLGANLGFLVFNFHPAKIFLGEAGSLWAGFMIGVLSIVSGSKVATTLLIMGIPFLDLLWVSLRRLLMEKHSLAQADSKHLHHRLLEVGLSHRSAVLTLYLITSAFGFAALFLQSFGKLVALIVLGLTMLGLALLLLSMNRHKNYAPKQP